MYIFLFQNKQSKKFVSFALVNVIIQVNHYHLFHHFNILSLILTTLRGRCYYPHFADGENGNFKMLSNWPNHTKLRSRGIRIQTQVCQNLGLCHQTPTKEIPRRHTSRLLIFEDIDHFNPMGVTLFPTIKSYDVLLRTHYFSLLYMTIVTLLINYQDTIVSDFLSQKDKIES